MADFSEALGHIEQLESELEAVRLVVGEGESGYAAAPSARQSALRHLELAMRHAVDSAWSLVEEADWDEPEDGPDAIDILAEEDVIPPALASTLTGLVEYAAEFGEDAVRAPGAAESYEQLQEAAEALPLYVEYVHQFLKEWEA